MKQKSKTTLLQGEWRKKQLIVFVCILGVLYVLFGIYSVIFYVRDFVIPETRENRFDYQMIIVMIITLINPISYWFIRGLLKAM